MAAIASVAVLASLAPSAPASALELKVADSFPAGHYLVRLLLKPWLDDVTKRTDGKVTFTYYPNQQIGKAADMLRLTQSGVIDIGYVAPSYVSDKMPLSEVAQLPEAFSTSCEGTLAYWKSAREGILAKQEYAPTKIKLLMAVVLPPYQIFTTKQKVETAKDIRGLKLRTTGGAQDLTLRALDAVPVRMSAPEAYESLSRGTLDGLLFPQESLHDYGVEKLLKHGTVGVGFGSFVVAYSINQSVWDKLPDDVKTAMNAASEAIEPKVCSDIDQTSKETTAELQKVGISYDPIAEAGREEIRGKLKAVSQEWAAALDKRGKPATEALKEFEALLAEAKTKK